MAKCREFKAVLSNEIARHEKYARRLSSDIEKNDIELREATTKLSKLWSTVAANAMADKVTLPKGIEYELEKRDRSHEGDLKIIEECKIELGPLKERRHELELELLKAKEIRLAKSKSKNEAIADDPEVQEIQSRLETCQRIFEQLDHSLSGIEQEITEKRKAYEADKGFMYLRKRGYGTDSYEEKSLLVKSWDQKLAQMMDYSSVAKSYELLIGSADWMRRKRDEASNDCEQTNLQLQKLIDKHSVEYNEAEREVARIATAYKVVDRQIDDIDEKITKCTQRVEAHRMEEDAHLRQIVEKFTIMLRDGEAIDADKLIRKYAGEQGFIRQLELKNKIDELVFTSKKLGSELRETRARIGVAQKVVNRISRSGWDSSSHRFEGLDANSLMHKIMLGQIDEGRAIKMCETAHRVNQNRDYYSPEGRSPRSNGDSSSSTASWSSNSSFGGSDSFSTSDSF